MNVDKGWEIYPEAVYDIALKMRDQYGNIPWFLSENGVGISGEDRYRDESGQIQDDYRIQFLKEHLTYLHKGIQAGSNCFGYHVWTPIDCWSWLNAYKNRYGLVENNHRTQLRRVKNQGIGLRRWQRQMELAKKRRKTQKPAQSPLKLGLEKLREILQEQLVALAVLPVRVIG